MAVKITKAVFLDRDGVIIKEKNFNADPEQIEFLPGSLDALMKIPDDFLKIIVSNQSGIGRGLFNTSQVDEFNSVLLSKIKKKGASIDEIYYCPHKPENGCNCRKPKTGLFGLAKNKYKIDFLSSWMIGDKSSDIQAGKNIGATTILVLTGYGGKETGGKGVVADYTVNNLYDAVEIIRK